MLTEEDEAGGTAVTHDWGKIGGAQLTGNENLRDFLGKIPEFK